MRQYECAGQLRLQPDERHRLERGHQLLSVIFTPADTVDYSSVTDSVSLVVLPAPLTVTASNASEPYGQFDPAFTGAIAGVTNGDNITATYSCSATANSPPGTYPIVAGLVDPDDRQTNYTVPDQRHADHHHGRSGSGMDESRSHYLWMRPWPPTNWTRRRLCPAACLLTQRTAPS